MNMKTFAVLISLAVAVDWSEQCGGVHSGADANEWQTYALLDLLGAYTTLSTGRLLEFSFQQLEDCTTSDAMKSYIASKGLCSESDYPYMSQKGACHDFVCAGRALPSGTSWPNVTAGSEGDLASALKQGPIVVGANLEVLDAYTGGVFSGDCDDSVSGVLLLVGDGSDSDGEFWRLKHAKGEAWGEKGYLRIRKQGASKKALCGLTKAPYYAKLPPMMFKSTLLV